VLLFPELRIARLPVNDGVFHLAASERLADAFARREPFLDPWVSEWSLGYPVWRSYQPLPHVVGALALRLAEGHVSHAASFAALQYLLLVLLPASIYGGARLMGAPPIAAGLASILSLAPSAEGGLDRWGLGYGATVWRGSGLYTQLFALHCLAWSWGMTVRALDGARRRGTAAALLAATALSHIVFGYVAFLSAIVLAVVGPSGERSRRLARLPALFAMALALLAWFVIPLVLSGGEVNHSRWEDAYKWDSFGAPFLLERLASGHLLDAGRAPILTVFLAVGVVIAIARSEEALPRRLLALVAVWLALFFGRETWGHLLLTLGIPADFHLHRLQAAFELSAVMLAAWGISAVLGVLREADRRLAFAAAGVVAVALLAAGRDRARYLEQSATWGRESLEAYEREHADIDATLGDVRAIVAERPGRVSAGLAASWGSQFKVGAVPVYALLTRAHFDQASFLFHSMSLTSDVMVLRDDGNPADATAFGIRAIVASVGRAMPEPYRLRGRHGRFAVYEASAEGYFGLVDVGALYTGPRSSFYEPSAAWVHSDLERLGIVAAFDSSDGALPRFGRWEKFPQPTLVMLTARGRVVSESKHGEVYEARLFVERPCYALVKITWFPDLVATVDGVAARTLRVTPGFAAVALSPGTHTVVVGYQPGPLKPVLFAAGLFVFASLLALARHPGAAALEDRARATLERVNVHVAGERGRSAVALMLLALLALRPLFRGRLVSGHDALEYPPRLVEMLRVSMAGHLPPVWAPDLGNGHGQPLFEFAPPLLYATALPLRLLDLRLADSLQLALAALFFCSAAAMYRLGRRSGGSRAAAVGVAAAWLFAPYVALDLYVRAAFAESAALAVAPIALLGVLRAVDRPSASTIALGAAAVALLPLAHNGAALLMVPAVALMAVSAHRGARSIAAGVVSLSAGLLLSAVFWLPALVEKDFVKTDLLREDFLRWSEHAVAPWQLLWSRWGYGYSVAGTNDGMSFALGIATLVLAAAGVTATLRDAPARRRRETVALVLIALVGAWLATDWSAAIWSRAPTLQYLAYPWRALALPGLALPLLALGAFARLPARARALAIALLVLLNVAHTEPKGYLTFDDEYYAPESIAQKGINTTTREEYEPRWVGTRPPYTPERLFARDGAIEAAQRRSDVAWQELTVRSPAPVEVAATTFFYPGWTVLLDGEPIAARPASGTGFITFDLPAGEHDVRLELRPTRVRRIATLVSLATAATLLLAAIAAILRRKRGHS
jgi:6-pyruvoyl-tetrahydropterin synthase related domain